MERIDQIVQVETKLSQLLRAPIAAQLCEDFGEWLEQQGFQLDAERAVSGPNRDWAELARDFITSRAE